jgi:hypothetical protein
MAFLTQLKSLFQLPQALVKQRIAEDQARAIQNRLGAVQAKKSAPILPKQNVAPQVQRPIVSQPPPQKPVSQQPPQQSFSAPSFQSPTPPQRNSQIGAIQNTLDNLRTGISNFATQSQQPPAPTYTPPDYLKQAEENLITASKVTPEEHETQQTLANLLASKELGIADVREKPIAMPFITGQEAAIERRAAVKTLPLQSQLASLQAKRQSSLDVAKTQYDIAKTRESATKPIEVGGNLVKYNPQTSKYESVFTSPKANEVKAPTTLDTAQGIMQWDSSTNSWKSTGFTKPSSETSIKRSQEMEDRELQQQQQNSQALQNINALLADDRYKSISGVTQTGSIPFVGDRTAVGLYDQLQGLLKLGIRGLIKGQGQVSDYEGRILADAASSLSRLTGEKQMKQALLKVRGVLRTNAGQETDVRVTNPNGEVIERVLASGEEIYNLVSQGNIVEYL